MKTSFLLGRLVFGGFFFYNGINHFKEKQALTQYVSAKQIPFPEAAVAVSGAAMLAGGASIILGVKPKMGSLSLIAFLAGVSPLIHNFWTNEDPQQRKNDMAHFMKNMALMGAAMALMGVDEPWPASLPVCQPTKLDRVRRFAREMVA